MRSNSILRRFIAILVTAGLCMAYLPVVKSRVNADPDPGQSEGKVYYVYLNENHYQLFESKDAANGMYLGIFIDNMQGYVPDSVPDADEAFIVNNSSVDARAFAGFPAPDCLLLGTSAIATADYDIYSSIQDNAYVVGGDVSLDKFVDYLNTKIEDEITNEDLIKGSYHYEITRTYNVTGPWGVPEIYVDQGAELIISREGEHDHTNLDVNVLSIDGKLTIRGNDNGSPNGITIGDGGRLDFGDNATFDISNGSVLEIGNNVSGSAGLGQGRYTYDSTNEKWVSDEPQRTEGIYIDNNSEMFATLTCSAGNIVLDKDMFISKALYENETSITFTYTLAEGVGDYVIDVEDAHGGYLENAVDTDAKTITIAIDGEHDWEPWYEIRIHAPHHGPQHDNDGIYIDNHAGFLSSVSYSVGYADPVEVTFDQDEAFIAPENYSAGEIIKITYTLSDIVHEGDLYEVIAVDPYGGTSNVNYTTQTITITKVNTNWERWYDISVRWPEIQPGNQGMEFEFDHNYVTVEYALNGVNPRAFTGEGPYIIPMDDLDTATSVAIHITVEEGHEIDRITVNWDNDGDGTPEMDLEQTYGSGTTEFEIAKPQDEIGWGKRVIVSIETRQSQPVDPQEDRFEIDVYKTGVGNVTIDPENVVIFDGNQDDHKEYIIELNDWDKFCIRFEPLTNEGYSIKSVKVDGTEVQLSNNTYTLTEAPEKDAHIRIDVEFFISDEDRVKDIAEHGYAYTISGTTSPADVPEMLYNFFVDESWCWYFQSGEDIHEGKYSGLFTDKEDYMRNAVSRPTEIKAADDAVGLPYVEITLTVAGISENIKVYILSHPGFIVVTPSKADPSVNEYTIVDTSKWQNGRGMDITLKFDHDVGGPPVFGNGVDVNGQILSDSGDIFSCHVNQMHSGESSEKFDNDQGYPLNYVNVRLIIVTILDDSTAAARIQGDQSCAGWDFENLNTYTAGTTLTDTMHAYIYIGCETVFISSVIYDNAQTYADSPRVIDVQVDGSTGLVGNNLVEIIPSASGDFTVAFKSSFDIIPLALTYSDGATRYLYLHRVGLRVEERGIQNETVGDGRAIYGTYYYPTGSTMPTSADNVDLFVSITLKNGDVETRLISEPNPEYTDTGDGPNETIWNRWCTRFELWSGTQADYDRIQKVEVIVFKTSTDDNVFGGVVVGSGRGVIWEAEH